jgi:hypothetical protein
VIRSCVGGCLGRILFVILALVMLALYIKYHGPVM